MTLKEFRKMTKNLPGNTEMIQSVGGYYEPVDVTEGTALYSGLDWEWNEDTPENRKKRCGIRTKVLIIS